GPGYGAPQTGYPQPGYGGQPGGPVPPAFSIGDALTWAWNKFTQNAAALIVPTLVYLVGIGILYGVNLGANLALSESTTTTYTDAYGNTSAHVVSSPGVGG